MKKNLCKDGRCLSDDRSICGETSCVLPQDKLYRAETQDELHRDELRAGETHSMSRGETVMHRGGISCMLREDKCLYACTYQKELAMP